MSYGPTQRTKPRVQVLRGWDPMSPNTFTSTAAPGETIRSGQLVSKVWNVSKFNFVLGNAAGIAPAIAWSDSADMDVVESGILTGLSCTGNFEIQTGFYDSGTYTEGTPLTWSTVTPGNVCVAVATKPIIGYVTRINGPKQLNNPATGVFEDSTVAPANSSVIIFQTSYAGAKV